MGWRGVAKGFAVGFLIVLCVVGLWFGAVYVLFGRWQAALAVFVFIASFRGIIWAFDIMWGRPPVFSKRPWERPWEQESRRPPGG
ncbi:MAG: hypothetical protein A2Z12_01640 [Actinobacteria bacterium RBG_16_68_21]|nr:MAG: hypothetical protein A2Z12_01640 [Actinobacteria bacterium RBG_16_68_21]